LACLELTAEEIEDPFGKDANDLQTKKDSRVTRHIEELL
jgi:predicted membrane chloride channel (bestrophin family)